jgi:hypothetical protein
MNIDARPNNPDNNRRDMQVYNPFIEPVLIGLHSDSIYTEGGRRTRSTLTFNEQVQQHRSTIIFEFVVIVYLTVSLLYSERTS